MKNRQFLITGGSSGIGLELARRLIADGAVVHITGRSQARLDAAVAELGDRVEAWCSDVADRAARNRLMDDVTNATKGRLDGLIINAAHYGFTPLLNLGDDEFDTYLNTNTTSAFHLVKRAHPLLLKGEGKSVLFVSSNLSSRPIAGVGAYAASKAAMNSLAQSWAVELAGDGIRVNAVLPGVVDTPIHDPREPGDPSREEKLAMLASAHPLGRVGTPGDVAQAALYLLSEKASWVTGSLFYVDGGISLV